jgi:N-acetylmuramidase
MTLFVGPGPLGTVQSSTSPPNGVTTPFWTPFPGVFGSANPWPFLQAPLQTPNYSRTVDALFTSCFGPKLGISEEYYAKAAATLKVEIEAIKAVAEVETKSGAFDTLGRPTILFERHYFHRFTAGKFAAANPDISKKSAGGYGKFSAQYPKLERAYKLDPEAALKSASWGKFQIMGANHASAGFSSVFAFVASMMHSEANHLDAFVRFINASTVLLNALRNKDWTKFASTYNGPGYKKNDYDTKMRDTYNALVATRPSAKK